MVGLVVLTFAEVARDHPERARLERYYGACYRSALHPFLQRINGYLMRWIRKKHERLRAFKRAKHAGTGSAQYPAMFAHWHWTNRMSTRMARAG